MKSFQEHLVSKCHMDEGTSFPKPWNSDFVILMKSIYRVPAHAPIT